MLVWELKKLLKDLPEDSEVLIQDTVGDIFGTITAFSIKDEKTLTILADDIIF